MAEEKKRYKIGELARLTGLTPRTLRYYEELDLIKSERTAGGQRLYGSASRKRLDMIESLKAAGFRLQEIRHLLLEWKRSSVGREAAEKLLAILETKHREVTRTVEILTRLKHQLEVSMEMLEGCSSCSQKPEPELCGSCDAPQESGKDNPLIDEILRS